MRNTFCVKFYCRNAAIRKDGKAPIEVSVIVNGERQLWQLPKKCIPEDFKTNKDAQLYCTAIENKINEIYTNLTINNEPITAFIIKDIFFNGNNAKSYTIAKMFEDGLKLKRLNNDNISTYNKYVMVTKRFYEFTDKKEQNEANSVTYTDILKVKAGLERLHKLQTVYKDLQHLKYFFNIAFNSGKIKQNPFTGLKIKNVKIDKPYLTYEEICSIRDLKITNDRLDKVRDLFLFLCFTGLEWADLINLKKEDVKQNKMGQYYIQKPRIKTGIEYISILYEDAEEIWKLYDGELPIISPQKFNKYLKELAIMANIAKDITSLTCRHSFAVFLLSYKNLPFEIISKMLGHETIKQSAHYAKIITDAVFKANGNTNRKITTTKQDLTDIEEFNKLLGI